MVSHAVTSARSSVGHPGKAPELPARPLPNN